MGWTVFAAIYDGFAVPMIALTNVLVSALQAWVIEWMRDAMVVLLVGTLLLASLRGDKDPFTILMIELVKYWFAATLVTSALGLGPAVRDLLLTGIEREIGGRLLGLSGARMVTGAIFDELWNRAFAGGLRVMRNLPWSIAGFGMMLTVLAYWAAALVGTVMAFAIWMRAFVMTAMLVGLWPVFVGLWIFPWFRFLFWGWVHSVFSNVILKVLSTLLLSVVLGGLQTLLQTMLTNAGAAGTGVSLLANEWLQLQMLMGAAALFGCCGWLAFQLPGLAASIGSGFSGYGHLAISGLRGAFSGGGASGNGDSGGRGGGRSDYNRRDGSDGSPANDSVPVVRNEPPGRSLSNG